MATWSIFAAAQPDLAESIRSLIYQYGPGLAFLATIRADGGPRVHPVCPIVTPDDLFCFVTQDSHKRRDLDRDGRYALHAFPPEQVDDEAYVTGTARRIEDEGRRRVPKAAYHVPEVPDDHLLYELSVERAMLARYEYRGQWPPAYTVWRDGTP